MKKKTIFKGTLGDLKRIARSEGMIDMQDVLDLLNNLTNSQYAHKTWEDNILLPVEIIKLEMEKLK